MGGSAASSARICSGPELEQLYHHRIFCARRPATFGCFFRFTHRPQARHDDWLSVADSRTSSAMCNLVMLRGARQSNEKRAFQDQQTSSSHDYVLHHGAGPNASRSALAASAACHLSLQHGMSVQIWSQLVHVGHRHARLAARQRLIVAEDCTRFGRIVLCAPIAALRVCCAACPLA